MPNKLLNVISGVLNEFRKWISDRKTDLWYFISSLWGKYPSEIRTYVGWRIIILGIIYPFLRISRGKMAARGYSTRLFKKIGLKPISMPVFWGGTVAVRDMSDFYIFNELYNRSEHSLYKNMIKRGMVVVDAGAHIGYYTLMTAYRVAKEGLIIAFEPEPDNFQLLCRQVRRSNFSNILCLPYALADFHGKSTLFLQQGRGTHTLYLHQNPEYTPYLRGRVTVSVRSLDEELKKRGIKKIDLLKIDTEGAELPILKGAQKTLQSSPNCRFIISRTIIRAKKKKLFHFLKVKASG